MCTRGIGAMFVLGVCVVFAGGWILWNAWRRRKCPPGPWGLPFVGYLPWLDPEAPYISFTNLARKYGPIYGLWMGSVYTVVVSDHKVIRKVLAKDVFSGRAPLYLTHGIMNGYGIICAEGELWKDQRKFVSGCLRNFGGTKNSPRREIMKEIIKNGVNEFLQYIRDEIGSDGSMDPEPMLRHCVGNVMNSIVFGFSWTPDDKMWHWLQKLQEEGTKHIGVAGPLNFLPFLRFVPKFKKTMHFLLDGKQKTHKFYQCLIDDHSKILDKNENTDTNNIIDAFLMERQKRQNSNDPSARFFSDSQFYHLLADVFGAGLDTTLTTLRWFFLFMAAYPSEQKKVQEELDAVLSGKPPDLTDWSSLPLTEAALCETQRIRSVVPVGIPHGTLETTEIEGYMIPKSTMVMPLQWAVHMDPNLWTKPHLYDPSRFIDSEGRLVKPDYFLPYQTGKRMCLGDELARMLLYLFGSTVIQKYHITCSIDDQIDLNGQCGIMLNPTKHRLIFKHREVK